MEVLAVKKLMVLCAFLSLVALVDNASADMTVTWSTGGVTADRIGWDGTFPGDYDIVTLDAASGGPLTLDPYTPVTVAINPLTFEVGLNAQNGSTNYFTMTRDITVNGITGSLSNDLSNLMRVDISTSDTLYVYGGSPVRLGDIIVTPLGWTSPLSIYQAGVYHDFVYARLELVPVPAAVLLGLLGLGAAGVKLRRFV